MVKFAADAGARLSVNGLYTIVGVDCLKAAGINFSSTRALRFADFEVMPSNNILGPVNTRPLRDVRMNHSEGNREERIGRFLTTKAPDVIMLAAIDLDLMQSVSMAIGFH